MLEIKKNVNNDPHVVILGAGASLAACPQGDKYGRKLPLMSNFVKTLRLEQLLSDNGVDYKGKNFEELYDGLYQHPAIYQGLLIKIENCIRGYFSQLRLPDAVTLYDELLLSLRKKDIIATFNWDPLLLQAYQRNSKIKELPEIVFLHGNVGVGICIKDRVRGNIGNRCSKCDEIFEKSQLLFPIRDKSYNQNPFIEGEWRELEAHLQYAFMLTIFGYSAPVVDIDAVALMKRAWSLNGARELAQVEIIDIKNKKGLLGTWKDFITSHHYTVCRRVSQSDIFQYPRRSCEGLAWAVLQNDPWNEKPLPRFRRLNKLQDWVQPLVSQEIAYRDHGTPLQRF